MSPPDRGRRASVQEELANPNLEVQVLNPLTAEDASQCWKGRFVNRPCYGSTNHIVMMGLGVFAEVPHQAERTSTPGYASVPSPFSNVTWPLTMIQR